MKLLCERSDFRTFWKTGQKVYIIYIATSKERGNIAMHRWYQWQWGVNRSLCSTAACSSLAGSFRDPFSDPARFSDCVAEKNVGEKKLS